MINLVIVYLMKKKSAQHVALTIRGTPIKMYVEKLRLINNIYFTIHKQFFLLRHIYDLC